MLLAVDTSTSFASIALVERQRTVAELSWDVGQRHSTELLERLEWLLGVAQVGVAELEGSAVATGPGSFNGVRVAVTTAKTLAFAHGLPLFGQPTLDIIAWGCAAATGPVWALLEAGRGQVYAARYEAPARDAARWAPVDGYHIMTPTELSETTGASVLLCGEWRDETQAALREALGERARFSPVLGNRRSAWLAQLALARAARGTPDTAAGLEPLYLRRPAITTSSKVSLKPGANDSAGRTKASASGREGVSRALHR
ncbi:MAG TPA: tRNA (adenosine(37)-N6)-threonylcarbamoyltransferase complex dimerization subunit type 1 TsaB [Ktedonobacterales bacterium]|nr:tRNA (adenosine(37)-N6)-threonylcarbamoyltransferase complex dimerization subunit type 1 TsaB [Ktedonobacterales bacterium]